MRVLLQYLILLYITKLCLIARVIKIFLIQFIKSKRFKKSTLLNINFFIALLC